MPEPGTTDDTGVGAEAMAGAAEIAATAAVAGALLAQSITRALPPTSARFAAWLNTGPKADGPNR